MDVKLSISLNDKNNSLKPKDTCKAQGLLILEFIYLDIFRKNALLFNLCKIATQNNQYS